MIFSPASRRDWISEYHPAQPPTFPTESAQSGLMHRSDLWLRICAIRVGAPPPGGISYRTWRQPMAGTD